MTNYIFKNSDALHFIPFWVKTLAGLSVIPGLIAAGFNLFQAYAHALMGLSNIRITSIWDLHLMLTWNYLQLAGTFVGIIALLLGAAAIWDMFTSDESSAPEEDKDLENMFQTLIAAPLFIVIVGAVFLMLAFCVLMFIPTFFVGLWNPVMVFILLASLFFSVAAFLSVFFYALA